MMIMLELLNVKNVFLFLFTQKMYFSQVYFKVNGTLIKKGLVTGFSTVRNFNFSQKKFYYFVGNNVII